LNDQLKVKKNVIPGLIQMKKQIHYIGVAFKVQKVQVDCDETKYSDI